MCGICTRSSACTARRTSCASYWRRPSARLSSTARREAGSMDKIVGLLQEAVFDESRWTNLASSIDSACGLTGTQLVVAPDANGSVPDFHFGRALIRGEPREDLELEYIERYRHRDERTSDAGDAPGKAVPQHGSVDRERAEDVTRLCRLHPAVLQQRSVECTCSRPRWHEHLLVPQPADGRRWLVVRERGANRTAGAPCRALRARAAGVGRRRRARRCPGRFAGPNWFGCPSSRSERPGAGSERAWAPRVG